MISILLVVQVLLALTIIGLIMLQRGKGADAGASLGGGGGGASGSVFGARGAANFLSRTTAVLAAGFFINSLALAAISADMEAASSVETGSVLEKHAQPAGDVPAPSDVPAAEQEAPAPTSDIPASE